MALCLPPGRPRAALRRAAWTDLRQYLFHYVAVDVVEPLAVDSNAEQGGGLDVVDMHRVLDDVVGGDKAIFLARPGQPEQRWARAGTRRAAWTDAYARTCFTTSPCTSVSRLWSMPMQCRMVAWMSWTCTGFSTTL